MPVVRPQSSSQDFDFRRQQKRKKKKKESPAVINHIVTSQERKRMKQLILPLEDDLFEVKIFELYMYSAPSNHRYRTYGRHVDYTMAKDRNQAEELFTKSYPEWWKSMGVKEVQVDDVQNKLQQLEQQVDTCKFVLEAFIIVQ